MNYSYDDMIKAVVEERERIIRLVDEHNEEYGHWDNGLTASIRAFIPKPSDLPGGRNQAEDEGLMGLLERSGGRIREEEEEEAALERALSYQDEGYSTIDDLTTDLWGGAGPDCRTMPVPAG